MRSGGGDRYVQVYVRWEELDLDPTTPPGSCVLQ